MFDSYSKKVAVIGSGVMGVQIALLCVVCGYETTIISRNANGRAKARNKVINYLEMMQAGQKISEDKIPDILEKLKVTSKIANAIEAADIIIEAVVEDFEVKKKLFSNISNYCKENAMILTNSSSFVPSSFTEFIKSPEHFCALHFYSPVWNTCIVDVMYHAGTDEQTKENVVAFAKSLKQRPVIIKKETSNYVFNSILNQIVCTSIQLVADEVTDIEDVDALWKNILGTNVGPFGIMDVVGLDTIYRIFNQHISVYGTDNKRTEGYLKFIQKYIDKGDLGVKSGKGFYSYE